MFAGSVMECPAANKVAMLRCECFVRAAALLNRADASLVSYILHPQLKTKGFKGSQSSLCFTG